MRAWALCTSVWHCGRGSGTAPLPPLSAPHGFSGGSRSTHAKEQARANRTRAVLFRCSKMTFACRSRSLLFEALSRRHWVSEGEESRARGLLEGARTAAPGSRRSKRVYRRSNDSIQRTAPWARASYPSATHSYTARGGHREPSQRAEQGRTGRGPSVSSRAGDAGSTSECSFELCTRVDKRTHHQLPARRARTRRAFRGRPSLPRPGAPSPTSDGLGRHVTVSTTKPEEMPARAARQGECKDEDSPCSTAFLTLWPSSGSSHRLHLSQRSHVGSSGRRTRSGSRGCGQKCP